MVTQHSKNSHYPLKGRNDIVTACVPCDYEMVKWMKSQQKYRYVQTVCGDFCDWNAGLEWHETKHGEDDEPTKEAGSAVDDSDNDRVSTTHHKRSSFTDACLSSKINRKYIVYWISQDSTSMCVTVACFNKQNHVLTNSPYEIFLQSSADTRTLFHLMIITRSWLYCTA